MKRSLFLIAVLFIVGCAAPGPDHIEDHHGHIKTGDSSKISLGMTKLQVLHALGKPESTAADAHGETITYILERPWWQDKPFQVELKDDKVISFSVVESTKKDDPKP